MHPESTDTVGDDKTCQRTRMQLDDGSLNSELQWTLARCPLTQETPTKDPEADGIFRRLIADSSFISITDSFYCPLSQ